jgi:hypothetical protein
VTAVGNKISLLLIILFASISIAAFSTESQVVHFPGKVNSISSPDHKYRLINVDWDRQDDEGNNHRLMIEGGGKTRRMIFSYGRYIDVFWSPTSQFLVINDHGGSDYSTCVIVSTNEGQKESDIGKQLREQLRDSVYISGSHHLYIEGVQWLDKMTLKIRVHGYGSGFPKGFTLWYAYRIEDGIFRRMN